MFAVQKPGGKFLCALSTMSSNLRHIQGVPGTVYTNAREGFKTFLLATSQFHQEKKCAPKVLVERVNATAPTRVLRRFSLSKVVG